MTVLFNKLNELYGQFSNFWPSRIVMDGQVYATVEHYFQAEKFHGTLRAEEIRKAGNPMVAARMGRSREFPLRADWLHVRDEIMLRAVRAKFAQNEGLARILSGTGQKLIVEHRKKDGYWGDAGDGSGLNRLGEILMRVRSELRGA